jgi:hypothetical protein
MTIGIMTPLLGFLFSFRISFLEVLSTNLVIQFAVREGAPVAFFSPMGTANDNLVAFWHNFFSGEVFIRHVRLHPGHCCRSCRTCPTPGIFGALFLVLPVVVGPLVFPGTY